jgi:uncharacterized membrane protein (DUF2068 family)
MTGDKMEVKLKCYIFIYYKNKTWQTYMQILINLIYVKFEIYQKNHL